MTHHPKLRPYLNLIKMQYFMMLCVKLQPRSWGADHSVICIVIYRRQELLTYYNELFAWTFSTSLRCCLLCVTYHAPCFSLSDIVRVGSRSKNEALSRCNLRNRRVRKSTGLFHAYNDLRAKRETFLVSAQVPRYYPAAVRRQVLWKASDHLS